MYIDERLEFDDAHAYTADADSTSHVDLGADRNIGPGRQLWWVLQLDVVADDTTADETYVFYLETDTDTAFGTAERDIASIVVPRGTVAGTRFYLGVPNTNEQFLQTRFDGGGTTPTITVSQWLTSEEPTALQSYPDSPNIS